MSIVTVSDSVVSLRENLCRGLNFRASFKRSLKPSCVRHFKDGVWRFAAERRDVQGPAAGRQEPRPPPRGRALPRLCAWVPRSSPGVADPGAHGAGCCRTHGDSLLQRKDTKQNQQRERSHGMISGRPLGAGPAGTPCLARTQTPDTQKEARGFTTKPYGLGK